MFIMQKSVHAKNELADYTVSADTQHDTSKIINVCFMTQEYIIYISVQQSII